MKAGFDGYHDKYDSALRYARMVLSTRFHRRLHEGLSYWLALESIAAAKVAALNAQSAQGRG